MRIRLAREDDIAPMHHVRMSVRENRLRDAAKVGHEDYQRMLSSDGCGWVAEAEDGVVGFAVADLRRANIWALFVAPAFEGRGVGRALHEVMVQWLFDSGVDLVWLTTDPGTRAQRFYEAAGWRRVGLQDGEIRLELSRSEWLVALRRVAAPDKGLQGTRGIP